jgi:hypothetical protein
VQSGTAGILDTDHFEGILGSVRAASIEGRGLECLRCGKMIDHIDSESHIHKEEGLVGHTAYLRMTEVGILCGITIYRGLITVPNHLGRENASPHRRYERSQRGAGFLG